MSILKFLGIEADKEDGGNELDAVRLIREGLENLGQAKARYITAFALILGRVAAADNEISDEELREIDRIIRAEAGLDDKQAKLVVELTRNLALLEDTVETLVTAEFGRVASREQKTQLLNCLFSVAAAEGDISGVEEEMIHMIASEISLPQRDFIGVRYRYLKYITSRTKATSR